jgi:hypothetical protein
MPPRRHEIPGGQRACESGHAGTWAPAATNLLLMCAPNTQNQNQNRKTKKNPSTSAHQRQISHFIYCHIAHCRPSARAPARSESRGGVESWLRRTTQPPAASCQAAFFTDRLRTADQLRTAKCKLRSPSVRSLSVKNAAGGASDTPFTTPHLNQTHTESNIWYKQKRPSGRPFFEGRRPI